MAPHERVTALARPEIRALRAYVPAVRVPGAIRLNANESPWSDDDTDSGAGLNRYPEARPDVLTRALADHYGVADDAVLVSRGTSEAIDLLIRCFCRPGVDGVVICPPTFGMYEVYAGIQGARIKSVPLTLSPAFALDVESILSCWTGTDRLVFVTTPNNPTGNAQSTNEVARLAEALIGRGIVVVDAAYGEFTAIDELMRLHALPNVVILRTLSKAYGLAGVRCGAAVAAAPVIDLLARIMPPYSMPTPTVERAVAAVSDTAAFLAPRIATLRHERSRLEDALRALPNVTRVFPSAANFLLVEFTDPIAVLQAAAASNILLRDFSRSPHTPGCLRITIGTAAENRALLEALREPAAQGAFA